MKGIILIGLLAILLIAPAGFATTASITLSVQPGITPDSPLWGLDVAWDNLMFRIGGSDVKAKIMMERTAEVIAMANKNDTKHMQMALNEQEKCQQKIQREIQKGKMNERDIHNLQVGLNISEQKLQELKGKLPEDAQQGLDMAIEHIQKNQERAKAEKESMQNSEQYSVTVMDEKYNSTDVVPVSSKE